MINYFVTFFAMVVTAAFGFLFQPHLLLSDHLPRLNLETQIPNSFGNWISVKADNTQIVEPEQEAIIREIYTQTLSRIYQDTVSGTRIMLSIAYGDRQTDGKEVHKPEICYPAQGYTVSDFHKIRYKIENHSNELNAISMVAKSDYRTEPIVYWTTLGNKTFNSRLQKKIFEFEYALKGFVPDGLLFRVSTIEGNELKANQEIQLFINDLYRSLDAQTKQRLFGS